MDDFKNNSDLNSKKIMATFKNKLFVYHYDSTHHKHLIAQYKIKENDLILESKKTNIEIDYYFVGMAFLKKTQLVLLSYDGVYRRRQNYI